jgi:hypothetical protein
LGEGFLEKVCICHAKDTAVVGVELYVHDLLVLGAGYGDSGGESDFSWGVHDGNHGVGVGISHRNDKVGAL